LRIVLGIALNSGATIEEITEALLQVAIYAGYPAALDALPILQAVLGEKGIAMDTT
jgi:4-carboxymuconolactone decarboxylase